eukprot:222505-Rhodomonas_salina.1
MCIRDRAVRPALSLPPSLPLPLPHPLSIHPISQHLSLPVVVAADASAPADAARRGARLDTLCRTWL